MLRPFTPSDFPPKIQSPNITTFSVIPSFFSFFTILSSTLHLKPYSLSLLIAFYFLNFISNPTFPTPLLTSYPRSRFPVPRSASPSRQATSHYYPLSKQQQQQQQQQPLLHEFVWNEPSCFSFQLFKPAFFTLLLWTPFKLSLQEVPPCTSAWSSLYPTNRRISRTHLLHLTTFSTSLLDDLDLCVIASGSDRVAWHVSALVELLGPEWQGLEGESKLYANTATTVADDSDTAVEQDEA